MTEKQTPPLHNKGWSTERRRAQAERIRQNKPWEKSTGPKTEEGKERSRLNALKTGQYSVIFPHVKLLIKKNQEYLYLHHHFMSEMYALSTFLAQKKRTKDGINKNKDLAPPPFEIE